LLLARRDQPAAVGAAAAAVRARGGRARGRRRGQPRARRRRAGDCLRAPVRRLRRVRQPAAALASRARRLATDRRGAGADGVGAAALMRDLACLRDGVVAAPSLGDAFGWIVGLVLLALAAAASVSPIVRGRYRSRVARLMALEQVLPRPAAWWQRILRGADRADRAALATAASGVAELRARAALVERRLRRATLVAWAAFAIFAAAVAGVLGQSQAVVMRLADGAVAALFAVGPVLANLPPRWSRHALSLGALALAAGAALGTAIDPAGLDSIGDI